MKKIAVGIGLVLLHAIASAGNDVVHYRLDNAAAAESVDAAFQATKAQFTMDPNERARAENAFQELQKDSDRFKRLLITFSANQGRVSREIAVYSKGFQGGEGDFTIRPGEYFVIAGRKMETFRIALKLNRPVTRNQVSACINRATDDPEPSSYLASCVSGRRR